MRLSCAIVVLLVLVSAVAAVRRMPLDVTGTWEGRATMGRDAASADVAGVVAVTGTAVRGTIAVSLDDPILGGAYAVRGAANRRRLSLRGVNGQGARLRWMGTVAGDGLNGRFRLRRGRNRTKGMLRLARPTTPPDGNRGVCDDRFFTQQVMGRVLVPICKTCHAPGGDAGATALLVDANDVGATQRRVAQQIDAIDPSRSRILWKPLGLLPHGGGVQLAAAGDEADILRRWVDTVAASRCGGPPAGDPYSVHCGSCHGTDARGDAMRPSVRCAVHVRDPVRAGRGGGPDAMPPLGPDVLPDAELDAIVAHLATLCAESGEARPADLYQSNCATCHGRDAGGGANADGIAGPSIRCLGVSTYRDWTATGEGDMPAFPELTRADVGAIHDYASGLCGG